MADEKDKKEKKGEGDEVAAAAPAKKSKKKLFIAIGGVVFLLIAIGVPVFFMTMKKKTSAEEGAVVDASATDAAAVVPEGSNDEDQAGEGEEVLGAIFPLETFVVNLSGGRYIRCQIQLEMTQRDIPKKMYAKIVPVRDAIINMLSTKTADDMTSAKGKDALKSDIKDMVNQTLRKQEIKNVYFTQFVVQ
jgi:flagellar FliL protein